MEASRCCVPGCPDSPHHGVHAFCQRGGGEDDHAFGDKAGERRRMPKSADPRGQSASGDPYEGELADGRGIDEEKHNDALKGHGDGVRGEPADRRRERRPEQCGGKTASGGGEDDQRNRAEGEP